MNADLFEELGGIGNKVAAEAPDVAAILPQLLLHLPPPLLNGRHCCLGLQAVQSQWVMGNQHSAPTARCITDIPRLQPQPTSDELSGMSEPID